MITLALLMTLHFIADFTLQNNYMALGKSKAWKPLLLHTTIYSACFLMFGWKFSLVTWVLHTLTDYFTSRATSKLWFIDFQARKWPDSNDGFEYIAHISKNRHNFFVMIGLDQLIHCWCLCLTYLALVH